MPGLPEGPPLWRGPCCSATKILDRGSGLRPIGSHRPGSTAFFCALRERADPSQIALAAMFTVSASSAALNRNETTPCAATVRRMRADVTATSDTCEVIPTTKEK